MRIPETAAASLQNHRLLLETLTDAFRPHGFAKKGYGLWTRRSNPDRFAGFLLHPRGASRKRVEFCIITMGGWAQLHDLCWPAHRKRCSFGVGVDFTHFEHDMLVPAGDGFLARLWTLWPSTDMGAFCADVLQRISVETMPAIQTMLDRNMLIESLEREMAGGPIYVRARNYTLRRQILDRLKRLVED